MTTDPAPVTAPGPFMLTVVCDGCGGAFAWVLPHSDNALSVSMRGTCAPCAERQQEPPEHPGDSPPALPPVLVPAENRHSDDTEPEAVVPPAPEVSSVTITARAVPPLGGFDASELGRSPGILKA